VADLPHVVASFAILVKRLAALALFAGLAGGAWAQSVALQGMLGSRALLLIDGGAPRSLAVGDSAQGVKLVSVGADSAVVEIAGKRVALRLGESPASLGERGPASSGRISLPADGGGHFMGSGSINGRPVQFLVDTGASTVALSVADAERIGLAFREGPSVRVGTANGLAQGWRVKLASVRIGDVEVYEVDAIVTPQGMPFVLLGNSYLNRFQMRRDNDQMVLERRY
jgi:aspartyl protease family protein